MIEERVLRYYYARCDRCGNRTPDDVAPEDVRITMEELGWRHYSRWNGLAYAQMDLCPDCQEQAIQEGMIQPEQALDILPVSQ